MASIVRNNGSNPRFREAKRTRGDGGAASRVLRTEQKRHRIRGDIEDRYDVIVVGAGMGGLVASAILARAGKRVLTLDQHYVPGGSVTSFHRKEWRFEIGLHYIGECEPNGTIPRILSACGVDDIEFRPMDAELERLVIDGEEFVIPSDVVRFRDRLIDRFGQELRGIRRYFRLLEQLTRFAAAERSRSKWRQLRAIATSPLLLRWHGKTAGAFIDTCTQDPMLRAILTVQHMTYGCAPERVSLVMHAGLQMHYLRSGGWYPEGGGQRLSDRIAEELEKAGGQLRLRCPVTRILIENGRAVGVEIASKHLGKRAVRAPVIISNADVKRTYRDLVGAEHLSPALASRADNFEMALPIFVVFVGLDIPPSRLAHGNSNLWLSDRTDIDGDYRMIEGGAMPQKPAICISTTSLKEHPDADIAPKGHTNLEVMTIVPKRLEYWGVTPSELADGTYKDNPRYLTRKQELTDACLDQTERLIPGLREHMVHVEAASPMTQHRYVASSNGSAYGLMATPDQFLNNRPDYDSGIPGLLLCGGSCRCGHGVMGAMGSGECAAGAVVPVFAK